jgi:DDE superfamily endonuclease
MSDSKARNTFRLSVGCISNCRKRVSKAIVDTLFLETVHWPDEAERREISRRFQLHWKLPNLVGVADGTLLPLAFEPSRQDSSDFHGRKHLWSLSMLVVNDDMRRIRYFHAGWPGCTHDDRILENSWLRRNATDNTVFSPREYIVGDCAYAPRWWLVPCFKKPPGGNLSREKETLNKLISKPRVTSEHTIGMLKARFPSLYYNSDYFAQFVDWIRR